MDRSARRTRFVGLALVLLAFLLAGCGGDGGNEAPTPTETSAEPTTQVTDSAPPASATERYENAEHGFAVDYPSTWARNDSPGGGAVVVFFALESTEDPLPANLNVVVEDLPFDLTARQYLDIGWEKLKPQLSDLEEIDTGELTVGGLPAASLEYRGRFEAMPNVGHFYQVAVLDERRAFVFTYVAGEDNFEAYRAGAESIIDSFALV